MASTKMGCFFLAEQTRQSTCWSERFAPPAPTQSSLLPQRLLCTKRLRPFRALALCQFPSTPTFSSTSTPCWLSRRRQSWFSFARPDNPTARLLDDSEILRLADSLLGKALVVVDQIYIDFSDRAPLISSRREPPQPCRAALLVEGIQPHRRTHGHHRGPRRNHSNLAPHNGAVFINCFVGASCTCRHERSGPGSRSAKHRAHQDRARAHA